MWLADICDSLSHDRSDFVYKRHITESHDTPVICELAIRVVEFHRCTITRQIRKLDPNLALCITFHPILAAQKLIQNSPFFSLLGDKVTFQVLPRFDIVGLVTWLESGQRKILVRRAESRIF